MISVRTRIWTVVLLFLDFCFSTAVVGRRPGRRCTQCERCSDQGADILRKALSDKATGAPVYSRKDVRGNERIGGVMNLVRHNGILLTMARWYVFACSGPHGRRDKRRRIEPTVEEIKDQTVLTNKWPDRKITTGEYQGYLKETRKRIDQMGRRHPPRTRIRNRHRHADPANDHTSLLFCPHADRLSAA